MRADSRVHRTAADRAVLAAFYDRLAEHRPFRQALQRLYRRLDALVPTPWPLLEPPAEQQAPEETNLDPFAAALAAPPSSHPAPWQILAALDRAAPAREAVGAFCQRWRLPAGAEQDLAWSYAHRHLIAERLVVPPTGGRAPGSVAVPVRTLVRSEREATRAFRRLRQDLLRSLRREPIPRRLSRATIDAAADLLFARIILRRSWATTVSAGEGNRTQRTDRARKVVQRWERRLWVGRAGHTEPPAR